MNQCSHKHVSLARRPYNKHVSFLGGLQFSRAVEMLAVNSDRVFKGKNMQFANVNGQVLHYQQIGAAKDKPTLVFANGLGTDFRIWRDVIVRLAGEFSMLTYDLRGHGLSDCGDDVFTIEDHVWDLAALLDHAEVENAYICGFSVGGMIAQGLQAARAELVRGLILCGTATKSGDPDAWQARIELVEEGGLEAIADETMERWFTPNFFDGRADLAGFRNMLVRQSVEGYTHTVNAIAGADMTEMSRENDVPTLCVAADGDYAMTVEMMSELTALIPHARLEVIEGGAHMFPVERAEELSLLIQKFAGKKPESNVKLEVVN